MTYDYKGKWKLGIWIEGDVYVEREMLKSLKATPIYSHILCFLDFSVFLPLNITYQQLVLSLVKVAIERNIKKIYGQ